MKANQLVAYMPRDTDGNVYKVEIGRIKSIAPDGNHAFVLYSEGGTAARTSMSDLMAISNDYVIKDTIAIAES